MAKSKGLVKIGGDWAAARPDIARLDAVNLETYAIMRTRRRVILAVFLFATVFSVISGRLMQLTFWSDARAAGASVVKEDRHLRPDILDRDGRVLATHILTTTLTANADNITEK